ncbi:hypothetical protein [Nocardia bovistercoris]|uniref:Uncharacterized protein n=1 Tax=Nocardia bovistercoris TaxID=2785916 RepID=A0A931N6L8_9NOCA|nr:hypothetical protein [Nocardia bovistercoris]MBH0780877.1 hypothetical protein [Nocardia bovistercoris]
MFRRKKKVTPARAATQVGASNAANVERVIVLHRGAAPHPDQLRQLVEYVLGVPTYNLHVTASRVDEPTVDVAYALIARFQSEGTIGADALDRASFQSLKTSLGPIVVVVVRGSGPPERHAYAPSPSPALPDEPIRHDGYVCPLCGFSQVLTQRQTARAQWQLDEERSVAHDFAVTLMFCAACETLINDDVNGDRAVVYQRLTTQAGAPAPRTSEMVHEVMHHVTRVRALSEPERQHDYDDVRQTWHCLDLRYIPEGELEDAVTRIIDGYFAEGANEFQVQTLENHVVQLSFSTSMGFRPVRLSRTSDGGFTAYGQVALYRFLGQGRPEASAPQAGVGGGVSTEDVLDAAVRELVTLGLAEGFLSPDGPGARTAEIGRQLDSAGGIDLMKAAHAVVASRVRHVPGMARELDVAWDGIGGWLG